MAVHTATHVCWREVGFTLLPPTIGEARGGCDKIKHMVVRQQKIEEAKNQPGLPLVCHSSKVVVDYLSVHYLPNSNPIQN